MGFNLDAFLTVPEHDSLNHAGLPGVGGGGGGTIFSVNEVAHGFEPGQPVYFDGATAGWNLASSGSDTTTADALVFAVTDDDNFEYILAGELELTENEWDVVVGATEGGLVIGEHYRLSITSGRLALKKQTGETTTQFVMRALSATRALVYLGEPHASSSASDPFELFPVGGIIPFGGLVADIPSGWLACDGSEYGRTGGDANPQPDLFQMIGITWGVGNGTTSFNVPDYRARSLAGINNANLPAGIDGGFTVREPADTTGAETHDHGAFTGLTNIAPVPNQYGTPIPSANPSPTINPHQHSVSSDSSLGPTAYTLYIIRATNNSGLTQSSGAAVIINSTVIVATDTAFIGERMIYDPSGGTFTLNAPPSPNLGGRWAVKNRTSSAAAITISGNGNNIENPLVSFSLSASFSLNGDGISVEWEYDGTQWLAI